MELKCLGAGHEVGRSAILIKGNDKILFDYGLKLNPKTCDPETISQTETPLPIKDYLSGIIISHAHLDHSGAVPTLYKDSNCPLFLTEATLELSNLLWKDTMKIAKIKKEECIFKQEDIDEAINSAFTLDFRKTVEITKNSKLTFYDAGHIVGSTISVLETEGKKIMYTGDFKVEGRLFPSYDSDLPEVDYLICESTYGKENHGNREELEKKFIEEVKDGLENGGTVIIPAFAIERSQEVMAILDQYNVNGVPIYLDGMAKKSTVIFSQYPKYFSDFKAFKKATKKVEFVKKQSTREKIVKQQCIIITTAGMLEGGPAMFYIKELGADPKNKIILTGYQVEGTNGYKLINTGKLIIDDREYQPKAKVSRYSLSGHAGKDDLINFVKKVNPKKVICVHGDEDSIAEFKNTLESQGFDVLAPKVGETVKLE